MVYQIFPDCFNNGNPHGEIQGRKKDSFIYATKEDSPYYIKEGHGDIARWDFLGGKLEGIRQKIPYLKDLGVTAIYLNPIFQASSNHRYDTQDFMKIDPMRPESRPSWGETSSWSLWPLASCFLFPAFPTSIMGMKPA
ncbi:hypothetical protein BTI91_07370 [Lactobacillus delbrueckii subsp. bulgaricus]|nr:hypothetical protein [Lactobacillus delbrueckii subsp. bulgaricus]